jgi:hypothetical protein
MGSPRWSGPHVRNSGTFSMQIMRGRTCAAHFTMTHASPRIFLLFGFPPLAREKWVQSGLAQSRSTGLEPTAFFGFTLNTSSWKCSVSGWFCSCIRMALRLWLMAT